MNTIYNMYKRGLCALCLLTTVGMSVSAQQIRTSYFMQSSTARTTMESGVSSRERLCLHSGIRCGGASYGTNGIAVDNFIYPKNELCLLRILDILEEEGIPHRIFGKGSNILCSDDDYEGAILCLDRYFTDFFFEEEGSCRYRRVPASSCLHMSDEKILQRAGVCQWHPRYAWGRCFMNAGAYKSDISQILKEVYILKDRSIVVMRVEELEYAYRHSIFQSHRDWIILGARLQLQLGDQKEIRDLMDSRRKRRMDSQPLDKPCAGSMFRNPKDHQAWQLIEEIGMRGTRIGGAMVSEKHANFIVNEDHARAEDVVQLVEVIQKEVQDRFWC